MKFKTEINKDLAEEIIVRAPEMTPEIARMTEEIARIISESSEMVLCDGDRELYVNISELLFFETYDGRVYAHTAGGCYLCRMKLYELEEMLPRTFVRASKACLVNTAKICAIHRYITGTADAEFFSSSKKVSLSRMYYHSVRNVIEETRLKR